MFTTAAAFDARSAGRTAFVRRAAAKKLSAKLSCQALSVIVHDPCRNAPAPPALFTRMSRPPSAASDFVAIASTPSLVLTSPATNVAAAGVSSLRVRAATTTLAPASRRRCAIAAPIPRVPPVMRARRPPSSFERSSLLDMGWFLAGGLKFPERRSRPQENHDLAVIAVRRSRDLLEQVLEDQRPPALVRARLYQRAALCELAEIDWRETELFGERCDRRRGAFVVARQERDPAAALDARVGGQGAGEEMVEALHQPGTPEGFGDDGRGDAKPVHRVDDRLALPARQIFGDLAMFLERNGQKDHVRLDGFRQRPGDDRGSDGLRLRQERFGRAPAGDGDFDVVAGEGVGEGLADGAETDDCVVHVVLHFCTRIACNQSGPLDASKQLTKNN